MRRRCGAGDAATTPPQARPEPDEQQRTRIAWLYYVEGRTQAQIADRLGISRIKVESRAGDLPRHRAGPNPHQWSSRLLRRARTLAGTALRPQGSGRGALPRAGRELYPTLGIATGAWFSDRLAPGTTVGIGWGRTLHWSVRAIRRRAVPGLTVVSLLGGLGSRLGDQHLRDRLAICRGARRPVLLSGGPDLSPARPSCKTLLLDQEAIRDIYQRGRNADLAMVSVGSLAPGSTVRNLGLLTDEDLRTLHAAGAVGDLLGHWLDASGRIIDHPLNRRVVGLQPADLGRFPVPALVSGGRGQGAGHSRRAARPLRDDRHHRRGHGARAADRPIRLRWSGGALTAPSAATPVIRGKQRAKLLEHGAAELFGVGDRHRRAVIARDVVADADGEQLDARPPSIQPMTSRRCFSR